LSAAALTACATASAPGPERARARAELRSSLHTGLDLYDGGEFVLAGRRFSDAADRAAILGEDELERRATTAECTCWLRGRRLAELSECSRRLERLQRHARGPDPGVNTLIALGAIAGGRPLPPLKLPRAVAPLLRESVSGSL
jgi:hypothetical protein